MLGSTFALVTSFVMVLGHGFGTEDPYAPFSPEVAMTMSATETISISQGQTVSIYCTWTDADIWKSASGLTLSKGGLGFVDLGLLLSSESAPLTYSMPGGWLSGTEFSKTATVGVSFPSSASTQWSFAVVNWNCEDTADYQINDGSLPEATTIIYRSL